MSRLWMGAVIGLVVGTQVGRDHAHWLLLLAVAAVFLVTRRWDHRVLWLCCVAVGSADGQAESAWESVSPAALPNPFAGEIHLVRQRGDQHEVIISPDESPQHRVIVGLTDRKPGLAPGARVRFYGTTSRLRRADNPGGFDQRAHGRPDRIWWQGRGDLWMSAPAPHHRLLATQMRDGARARLRASKHPFGAQILTGLLLGDRRAVPAATRTALQTTGAAHLMAVSGLHVGGLALLVFGITRRLCAHFGSARPWFWAAWAALPPTGVFIVLAGAPPSAVRAGVMVTIYLLGILLSRRCRALDALAVAAVLLSVGSPSAVEGVGFQLSFVAVAALLLFAAGHRGLVALCVTAVVASLATAPIQAWHFGTVAPLGPVANLLLSPLAAMGVVPLGLLGLVSAPLTTLPLDLAALSAELLSTIAETMADWTYGPWVVGRWTAPIWTIPICILWGLSRRRWRGPLLAVLSLCGAGVYAHPEGDTVDFVAVGQGDAIIMRSRGQSALVDAGPQRSAFVLGNYLRNEGIDRLDWVLVTHGHPDHFRGLAELSKSVDIGVVWFNGYPTPGTEWQRLKRSLDVRKIPVIPAPVGLHRLGHLKITIFPPLVGPEVSENDASIAMQVEGPNGSILLTGDLESAGEAALLAQWAGPVDILKAPHHGSRTSSGTALLRTACARATVYSAGHGNRYGLPHPDVVARYARLGIPAWRTDADGRIRIKLSHPARIEGYRRPAVPLRALPRSCAQQVRAVALEP